MAGPGNRHCANCIGTRSYTVHRLGWTKCCVAGRPEDVCGDGIRADTGTWTALITSLGACSVTSMEVDGSTSFGLQSPDVAGRSMMTSLDRIAAYWRRHELRPMQAARREFNPSARSTAGSIYLYPVEIESAPYSEDENENSLCTKTSLMSYGGSSSYAQNGGTLWNYLKQVILITSNIVKNVFHLICQAICGENDWLTSSINKWVNDRALCL